MSTAPAPAEDEDQVDEILRWLIAERVGPQHPKLAVHETAVLRKAAILMASDGAEGAKDIAGLLELAPSIITPGAVPAPTLQQVSKPDAPWHLDRLSAEQLHMLDSIAACAVGAACPFVSDPRREACEALQLVLSGEAPDVGRVRELVTGILAGSPLALDSVFPSHQAELSAERSRRLRAEQDIERLEHALAHASKALPANVASLAAERAAREAPTMSSRPALR